MNDDNVVVYPGLGSGYAIHVRWETIRTWLSSFHATHNLCCVGLKRACHPKLSPSEQRRQEAYMAKFASTLDEDRSRPAKCRERRMHWLMSLTDEDKINLYFDVEIAHNITGEQYREMLEDAVQEVSKEIKDEEHPTTNTKI